MEKLDKKILTLIDGSKVNNFLDFAIKTLNVENDKIKKIVKSLLENNLIEIIKIEDKEFYSHTKKVKKDMLDEELHLKYGSRPLHTYS